jgi:hypothetical protein
MPNEIDTYGGRKVRTRPLDAPLVNPSIASPDAFGAAIGQGARGLVLDLAKVRQHADDDIADTEALEARNKYLDARNKQMANYLQETGKVALDLPDRGRVDHDALRDATMAELKTPAGKERFRQMMDAQWVREGGQLESHRANQQREYQTGTIEASILHTGTEALRAGTPKALEDGERLMRLDRQRLGDMVGMPGVAIENQHQRDRATLYGAAIEGKISGSQWADAKDYLARYGDRLDENKRADFSRRIADGGLNQQAQDTADEIMADPTRTRAQAYEGVAMLDDADLRQRTLAKVDQEFAHREAALAQARGDTFERLAKAVEEGADPDDLLAKDADAPALDQRDRDTLRRVGENAAHRRQPAALGERYYTLRTLAAEMQDEFMATDLRLERGRMPESERGALMEMQADMRARRAGGAGSKVPRGLLGIEDVANNTLRGIGINPAPEKGVVDPRALAFKGQFDRAVLAGGGADKLTSIDMQRIADGLVLEESRKVKRSGWNPASWFGSGEVEVPTRRFEMPGAARAAFSAEQVPAADRDRARAALVKRGIANPTAEQILDTYNKALAAQPPAGGK